ncbi:HNH endonuclease signature motif containing protein [Streptacidiphilus sp. MAP5-3]|uniref:HNH endonuclease signature motif containing protein n=1 Tax=unclassified Streptacidiphilus TaxID=2643834 RepID=UPI00351277D8
MLYTRECLSAITAEGGQLDDMLRRMGKDPSSHARCYLRKRLAEYGLPIPSDSRSWTHSPELLTEAVAASHSYAGVLRHLNLRPAGGTHAHVARRIRALGIDTSHFTGMAYNKGRSCPKKLSPAEVLVRRPPNSSRVRGWRLRQALHELGRPDLCAACGIGPVWQGRALTLEVDHINGDWADNRPENLRILCPNCHATTDTYCGRNHSRNRLPIPRDAAGR